MEKYELVDVLTNSRYPLLGISSEQRDSFSFLVGQNVYSVHKSHINVDCYIIYDKKYQLTDADVDYFYKDLGGK